MILGYSFQISKIQKRLLMLYKDAYKESKCSRMIATIQKHPDKIQHCFKQQQRVKMFTHTLIRESQNSYSKPL